MLSERQAAREPHLAGQGACRTLLAGLVVTRDGLVVTASASGVDILTLRDGRRIAIVKGGSTDSRLLYGNSLALVGRRLLAVGTDDTVLVLV